MKKLFKKKIVVKVKEVIKPKLGKEILIPIAGLPKEAPIKYFETNDKDLMYKLQAKGHKIKEVKSAFNNQGKIYIFHNSEKQIKEDLNE